MAFNSNKLWPGISGRNTPKDAPILGSLEIEVMDILWQTGESSAQAVLENLSSRKISLSTVQSTLERLVRKELLTRTKHGRAFWYTTLVSREELIGLMIQNVASRFTDGKLSPMISGFCSFVEENGSKRSSELTLLLKKYIGKHKKGKS